MRYKINVSIVQENKDIHREMESDCGGQRILLVLPLNLLNNILT